MRLNTDHKASIARLRARLSGKADHPRPKVLHQKLKRKENTIRRLKMSDDRKALRELQKKSTGKKSTNEKK
jgi:hypothetical protein